MGSQYTPVFHHALPDLHVTAAWVSSLSAGPLGAWSGSPGCRPGQPRRVRTYANTWAPWVPSRIARPLCCYQQWRIEYWRLDEAAPPVNRASSTVILAKELLARLQDQQPGQFPDSILRTMQRRVRAWRNAAARRLVFGPGEDSGSRHALEIAAIARSPRSPQACRVRSR
jgi:hypothetical protein